MMLVFLAVNGIELAYTQKELIDMGLSLAAGELTYEAVLQWIMVHQ